MSERKSFNKFRKKEPSLSIEKKIERFILRNSQNGFFTKMSTISYKFEISENKSWEIIGELLGEGTLEATHDQITGEMKLCEDGKAYEIMGQEIKRRKEKPKKYRKKANS